MPFDDNIKDPKITLKPQKQASIFDKMPKKPSKQEFEKQAAAANAQLNSYSERALEYTLAFKKLMEDKTVPLNKSVFAADLEKEVIGNLLNLAMEMNQDPNENEGMGSVGLIVFLLRLSLSQKDRINELDFRVHGLEKRLDQSEIHIKNLLSNIDTKK